MMRPAMVFAALALAACGQDEPASEPSAAPASIAAGKIAAAEPIPTSSATAPSTGPFAPRDDCAATPGAKQFRAALSEAVRRRDAAALVALADPAVRLDFGDGAGREELRQRLAGTKSGELWEELAAILPLGCALQEGALVMPWHFAQEFDDPYAVMIVTGAKVALRKEPAADTAPLTTLSWQAVELVGGLQTDKPFQRVKVPGGPTGWVATGELRSVLDYRLLANRDKRGDWKITAFVAGD